jgi:signal transduction histidine kinase/CheY-like chemotaxis protein
MAEPRSGRQSLRDAGQARKLTPTKTKNGSNTYYGMYSHSQDFYIYAYLPESAVFQTTTTNMAAALLLYILLISLFQMLRWRSSQKLIQQQNELDRIYKNQLEEKNQALELAVQHEAAANRSKREFLFNMSHDIRTPMNAIVGFTSLAATHIDNQEQALNYLKKISVSSQHLLSLINDILDMSRIESGKVKIEKKAVHLLDLIHDIRAIIQPNVAAKRLSLFIDTMDVIHEDIITDPLRLNQVLLNILSNAIKFTPAGGAISIRIFQKETLHKGCADYEFHIRDTGIGISKEFQAHIFEEFTRENTSTVSGIHGTGLGMSITKNIVDLLGGTIEVESEPGKGSEFTVCLRFPLSDAKTEQKRIPELEGLRALVADDDTNSCLNVSKMLRKIGMRPDWTISGKEAVIRARDAWEQGDSFHVYIIDWLIPDMNGIEVVRQIRKMIGEQTPIIILTAYDWADIEEEARKAGVTAFCTKPLFLSELREILAKPFESTNPTETANSKPVSFAGKKILLVEDNSLNQEIALAVLRERGLIVDTACDGSIAVQKVHEAKSGQYDLILMDIQMPIMDGYEATRQIRAMKDPDKSSIPIIAITANAFEEDCQNALAAGMNGHIAKPLDIQKLEQVLMEFLGS